MRLLALASFTTVGASADLPLPDLNFAQTLNKSACTAEPGNDYEKGFYKNEGWDSRGRYPGACQRLHFTYGPIAVKPGQNDVVITPTAIEKPAYDGYVVRFRPNLVRADGSIPPIEEVHLHHAVWFNVIGGPQDYRTPGNSAFFASGEEKTISDNPRGYGFPVYGSDNWDILYMIHNQRAQPDSVWITYDIDYIPAAMGQQMGMKSIYPVWLDVKPAIYPVFNVERKFSHRDPKTGKFICTYPKDQTADFDPWGNPATAQGQPGNNTGTIFTMPARGSPFGRISNFTGGTMVGLGGHLHPGGLSMNVDLKRGQQSQRILTSEAHYWDWQKPKVEGGPPTSWDLSMSVTGLPKWGVHVEPGDSFALSATYDGEIESTYEDMGIAIGWIAPDGPQGPTAPGLNPFTAKFDSKEGCPSGGMAKGYLCDKGWVTHGHMAEADNHGGPDGKLPPRMGSTATDVYISNFTYQAGSQGVLASSGTPAVPLGGSLTFHNLDEFADIWHSVTACAYPCSGKTGIAFPLGDGKSSRGDPIEFDSGQLGHEVTMGAVQLGGAKNQSNWTLDVTAANGFSPGSVYTYYCRVHPFMRGAFAVPGPGLPDPQPPEKPGPAPPAPGGDWRSYGHDYSNTRAQDQEHTIGVNNAGALAPAWTFSSQVAGGDGDFTGTPTVADGYIFAGTNRGWVFALNADTGAPVWKWKAPVGSINSTLTVSGGVVYTAVSHPTTTPGTVGPDINGPYVVALDETTGKVRWQTPLDNQAGSDVYGSPVVFDGVVIIGVSGEAAELGPAADRAVFHGSINYLDAPTGKLLKKTYSIPESDWAQGYAGGGIWSTPAVDPATRTGYVGSGNPFNKEKEHPNTDAILKLDLNRSHATFGDIIGVYKGNHDTYTDVHNLPCVPIPGNSPPYYPQGLGSCGQTDLDFGAAPNLMRGPGGRLEVGDAQKAGVYHVADAATMSGLWNTIVAPPVPTVGGVVGSTAFDGRNVYGPEVVGGYDWSVDTSTHGQRWVAPVAGGLDESNPVSFANGVVYNVDAKGFLDAYDASNGAPLLHRPIALGGNTGTSPASAWGGVAIARNTVYAETGITGLANGFIVAFKPGGSEGGGGGPLPGVPGAPGAGPTIIAGPGAYATTYATPVMASPTGSLVSFVNNDLPQHDVTAVDLGNGRPLFQSKLIGIGEVAPVSGTDKLKAGLYAFYCSIHPGMRGTLVVGP